MACGDPKLAAKIDRIDERLRKYWHKNGVVGDLSDEEWAEVHRLTQKRERYLVRFHATLEAYDDSAVSDQESQGDEEVAPQEFTQLQVPQSETTCW